MSVKVVGLTIINNQKIIEDRDAKQTISFSFLSGIRKDSLKLKAHHTANW